MGMVRERRTLGMQHQRRADLCAQMLGVGGDGAERFACDLEQQAVDERLVVIGDLSLCFREGEHHVVILHRQQFRLSRLKPALRGPCLALRAMPVAAGVVGQLGVVACIAAQSMAPSAAVRHCSMADMNLSCVRLRWLDWACR